MLGMGRCSRAILHSAESPAILLASGGRIVGNGAITEPLE